VSVSSSLQSPIQNKRNNRAAVASHIFAMLSLIFIVTPFGTTNGIAFLVLWILSFVSSLLAIVFGITALIGIRKHKELKGTGLVISSLVLGSMILIIWLFLTWLFYTNIRLPD
jgi:hypothetical protein